MKNKQLYNFLSICLMITVLGLFSCENEAIDASEEQLLEDALTGKKKNKKRAKATFDMSQDCWITSSTDLYAGQHILAGNVTVSQNAGMYTITYNVDSGYCLTETHLSVVETPNDFPMGGGGNPKNGHFEYKGSHDCVSSYSYEVPMSKGTYIAAHAVVNCISEPENPSEDIEASLPINAEICVTDKGDEDSYFDITVGGDNFLAGDYNAWCIDLYKSLDDGQCFNADIVPLLGGSSDSAVHKPENLRAVSWIINQDFVSQGYTFGEVQWAIWELLEDDNTPNFYCCLGDWDVSKGETIVSMALENSDFVPGCDDLYGIAILPTDASIQPVVIQIPIECNEVGDCEETAWGDGCDFPGNNWATYFQYSPE